ncbi:hypothetical protein KUCAC02_024025, partial [Chaenocephalus aceratus]
SPLLCSGGFYKLLFVFPCAGKLASSWYCFGISAPDPGKQPPATRSAEVTPPTTASRK